MPKAKIIKLEELLHHTYCACYSQILDMSNLMNTSDELDEGYIMELQKRIPALLHTIDTAIRFKKLIASEDTTDVSIK